MSDCIFCKMVEGEIKPNVALETDEVLAFHDINPQAPTHVLVIPKRHIPSLNELEPGDAELVGKLHMVARDVARQEGVGENFRMVINCGPGGGQDIYHIHLHVLGGRRAEWPPG